MYSITERGLPSKSDERHGDVEVADQRERVRPEAREHHRLADPELADELLEARSLAGRAALLPTDDQHRHIRDEPAKLGGGPDQHVVRLLRAQRRDHPDERPARVDAELRTHAGPPLRRPRIGDAVRDEADLRLRDSLDLDHLAPVVLRDGDEGVGTAGDQVPIEKAPPGLALE